MSLKSVKNKIRSINKTRQVTKAMESVSAVKMRKSQTTALSTRPYAIAALKILRSISGATETKLHPLMKSHKQGKVCIVVVSSDKGLAGSFGSTLLKEVYRYLMKRNLTSENVELVCVGKKAYEHFLKRGFTIVAHYEHWSDRVNFDSVRPLADLVKAGFMEDKYNEVQIIYTNFISTLTQLVYTRQLLPVTFEGVSELIEGITPAKGKYSESRQESLLQAKPSLEVVLEPDPETIMDELLPVLFNIQIYHSILESNASEHSSRMIAMKNASDSAADMSKTLTLRFNRVRQAAITKEVSEIVGGMESMRIID